MDPDTSDSERSVHRQAGIQSSLVKDMNYYDIMILGLTGQGKSTTADKLLIANPTAHDYGQDTTVMSPDIIMNGPKMNMEDLSMWLSEKDEDGLERLSTRLKNLVFFRKLINPHEHVNSFREAKMDVCKSTLSCELLSNETSRIRILDVPGFFGKVSAEQLQACLVPSSPTGMVTHNANTEHLGIMRHILHIQAMMSMNYRRILYFLPCRGRLERTNAALQQELQLMIHYFGRSIFESMVVIATLPDVTYDLLPPGVDVTFPAAKLEDTKRCFQEALSTFIKGDVPSPPVIFVSLTETCESILDKVQTTHVIRDGLVLRLSPSVCARCSMKIGSLNGERVAGMFGHDWSQSVLYEHSLCHPILVPKYTKLQKVKKGVAYTVKTVLSRDKWSWPDFNVEICPNCKEPSGAQGCMKIGQKYTLKKENRVIVVDHTSQFQESFEQHRYLIQDGDTYEWGSDLSDSENESDHGSEFDGGVMYTEDDQSESEFAGSGQIENLGHYEHVQVMVDIEPQSDDDAGAADVVSTERPLTSAVAQQEPPSDEIQKLSSQSVEDLKGT